MRIDDPRRSPALRNHYVYRYFDAQGVLLYVGCSLRPQTRWSEHKASRPAMCARVARVRMQGPYNYDTARALERKALLTEQPVYAVTPQDQSAKQRREGWIKRQMAPHVHPGMSTTEYVLVYARFAAEADRHDWFGIAHGMAVAA